MTQFNTATTDAPISHQSPTTQLIAGVSVSDTPLVTAVIEYAQRLSEPYLFNHAMRSWLFAEAIGRVKGLDYDREVFGERVIRSVTANTKQDGLDLLREAAAIPIKPHTVSFPLADANRALQELKAGHYSGAGVLALS